MRCVPANCCSRSIPANIRRRSIRRSEILLRPRPSLSRTSLTSPLYGPLQAGGNSRQDFDNQTQTTRATAAQVQVDQAAVEKAKLNLQWTKVAAPINGIAGIAKAQVGDLVSPTTLLTTVSQLDPIKVSFPISEREYLHFAERIPTPRSTSRMSSRASPVSARSGFSERRAAFSSIVGQGATAGIATGGKRVRIRRRARSRWRLTRFRTHFRKPFALGRAAPSHRF
jgi:multidrug efflux pump subunit AcrA (membrane-fusion protein)